MTRRRRTISAVILGSYVLATAAAWVHMAQRCEHPARLSASFRGSACCAQDHAGGHQDAPEPVQTELATGRPDDGSRERHRHDDCSMCRFQLAKKLAQLAPILISFSAVCPERLLLDAPAVRVAPLVATPDSRAPPALV